MLYIVLIVFILLFLFSHFFRQLVLHPIHTVHYAVVDVYHYLKHKAWNDCPTGNFICYFAHFGGGKTLSVTQYVAWLYRRYNDKPVFCRDRGKMVTQKVEVLSNTRFVGIPYSPLNALSDITARATYNKEIDLENDTLTVTLILIDEASSELNSREHRTNFDVDTVNTLITSRHYHLNLFYTSQKFKLTDALLRAVTQKCVHCRKIWRVMIQTVYSADQLDLAGDALLVRPLSRRSFFITDKVFGSYDTLATVNRLKKGAEMGEMLSAKEILELRGNSISGLDNVSSPSRKLRRMRKAGRK